MAKKETAEQKLLKMIEAANASKGLPPISQTPQKVSKKQSLLTVLKTCNLFLIAGVIASALLFINEVYAGAQRLKKGFDITPDQKRSKQVFNSESFMPVVQRLSFYLAATKNRNIFQPFEPQKPSGEGVVINKKIEDAVKKLRLVGISWLDTVESASVMIEDTDKQITYFLKTGEKLGDVVIKTIYADSALIGYDNEEIMLKYDKPQM